MPYVKSVWKRCDGYIFVGCDETDVNQRNDKRRRANDTQHHFTTMSSSCDYIFTMLMLKCAADVVQLQYFTFLSLRGYSKDNNSDC